MRWIPILALILVLAPACERETSTEEDATALEPGGGVAGAGDASTTTTGGATTATTAEATGAPSPPEGYAVDSKPAADGVLAAIEYLSPRTVQEVAEFYDRQIQTNRRVQLNVAGDDIVAYGMGGSSTIGPATRIQDVERLLDERSEAMVVVAPHRMQADDPLIGDLRGVGQQAQADALIGTRSKITVVYAVQ
ncbi:MAG TPA: hypothetical protein VEY33_05835 [Gemmatimonadota bacterium]|nr:hypothetical protein [Gemmatimonadota bacterium]